MSIYNAEITLQIPEPMRDIANAVGKAFDPDTGGEHTFDLEAIDGVIAVTIPCVQEFADAMPVFKAMPKLLCASVVRDYETRWPDLTPPTVEQCNEFCLSVEIVKNIASGEN